MEYEEQIITWRILHNEKRQVLESIDNRTIERDYDLYFTIKKLKQGNDLPVVKNGDPEFFKIVKKEIDYLESIIPLFNVWQDSLVKFGFFRHNYNITACKLKKRLFQIKDWYEWQKVTDHVAWANEDYLHLLQEELSYRKKPVSRSPRVHIENEIKIFYLEEQILIRNKAMEMVKHRTLVGVKEYNDKEFDTKVHFKVKIDAFNRIIGLLNKKLELLKSDCPDLKTIDKSNKPFYLHAINRAIKIFRLDADILGKEEFVRAYKEREKVL